MATGLSMFACDGFYVKTNRISVLQRCGKTTIVDSLGYFLNSLVRMVQNH